MFAFRRITRLAGRVISATVSARTLKQYPIIGVVMFTWRWWRRRTQRTERTSIHLRRGETITLQDKRS